MAVKSTLEKSANRASLDTKNMDPDMAKIQSHPAGPVHDDDAERLEHAGYAQELNRSFSLPAMSALCLCLMATWEALSSVATSALINGGAPCLFYNYLMSFLCTVAIACSLGEIASIYPTAGGQYYWVAALSPISGRRSAAFFTGWISIGAQVVFSASAAFAAGLQTQALITLNDDTYVPERWQGMLFYWAVLLYAAALNIWGIKLLPHVNLISGIVHVSGFVIIVVILGVMAPKNTASFVFVEFANNSGWTSDGASWLVGLLSAVYPFLGYDVACHLSEEMPHAARNVPIAMVGSVVANGLIGLVYCIVLLFSIGSLDSLLATPTGFPFMQIYLDATKSRAGATVMSLLVVIIAITATVACVTSASRTLWAFARDKAVPYDAYFSKVDDKRKVPIGSVVLVTVLQMLLGFIYLGNTTAFNAILAMAIIGLYVSYTLPIVYMLFNGRRNLKKNDYGPWKLGKVLGIILNVISIVWMTVAIIFSTFPSTMPVTAQNANYSSVVMAGWLACGAVYYVAFGRKKFDVPVVGTSVITSLSMSVSKA